MSQQHALRLAQLHNREDAIHHDLTTQDKVRWRRTVELLVEFRLQKLVKYISKVLTNKMLLIHIMLYGT